MTDSRHTLVFLWCCGQTRPMPNKAARLTCPPPSASSHSEQSDPTTNHFFYYTMADQVEAVLDRMVPALRDLLDRGIFAEVSLFIHQHPIHSFHVHPLTDVDWIHSRVKYMPLSQDVVNRNISFGVEIVVKQISLGISKRNKIWRSYDDCGVKRFSSWMNRVSTRVVVVSPRFHLHDRVRWLMLPSYNIFIISIPEPNENGKEIWPGIFSM